ncbi:MAG: hypothetical protein KDA75_01845 [Planctomycetaceae bacterium]|nr:hypothetical protein [Planctomycetaceae bacterium]
MSVPRLPAEISTLLETLRARIRRYVLIEGIAALIAVLAGFFWISFTADVAWFQLSKLELPLWFRWGLTTLAVALFFAAVATWLVFRLYRSFESKALALVLERRFPQLDDRLVTAVELSGQTPQHSGELGNVMLERTIGEAARVVKQVDLGSVFDSRPLRRTVLAAVVLGTSVLGFGVANASAMRRWYDAYIAGRENYWDPYRLSEMTIQVVAQPGDRVREFDAENAYKHPRGADLTVLVTVREGKQVPSTVTLRHRSYGAAGATRGAVSMSRVGERQFRHTLGRVIDPHELWVVGGDFTNRAPLQIQIVDPPKVDRIELQPDYPSYTGMDPLEDRPVVVQGTRVSLPMETQFVLRASANKPLVWVEARTPRFQIEIGAQSTSGRPGLSTLTLTDLTSNESRLLLLQDDLAATLIPGDRRTLTLPLQLSTGADAALLSLFDSAGESPTPIEFPVPFPLPPDQPLQIYLEDVDDIRSFDPATVTINAIPDSPPTIDVRLTGIGNRITRLASIPISGRLMDDYGVREAWFAYQRPEDQELQAAPLQNPPRNRTDFELQRTAEEKAERFDVLPLQMDVGERLTVALLARDGDNLNGPHESSSPTFAFEIVSNEALLGDLYDKEMNLRLRFEHIREEADALRTDLLLHRGRYSDGEKLKSAPPQGREPAEIAEELRQIGVAVQACADRSLHLLRKNHAETREVEARFRDIREELVNNRVDTTDALIRLDDGIIAPLAALTALDFPGVDEILGLFGLTLERQQDPRSVIDDAVLGLDRMIVQMDRILEQMQQRKGFNELIQELQGLLDRQKQVLDATEQERQRNLIDDLFK